MNYYEVFEENVGDDKVCPICFGDGALHDITQAVICGEALQQKLYVGSIVFNKMMVERDQEKGSGND